jgi:carboxylate-amine ligase
MTILDVVHADLARLRKRSRDPGFDQACAVIGQLMKDGGQARWLRAHLDAGGGMNDLARMASELFDSPGLA